MGASAVFKPFAIGRAMPYHSAMVASDQPLLSPAERVALLSFYADAGVDCMLEDAPVDRFAEHAAQLAARAGPIVAAEPSPTEQPPRERNAPAPQAPRPPGAGRVLQSSSSDPTKPLPVPDEATLNDARIAARQAGSLAELREVLEGFEACALKFSAKNTVFADGNPEADIMFVGEAPGRDEDMQGLPFVGRAGQLLDRMLAAIGRDRQSVYITNMIFWRPPGNRTPTPHEIALCRPFTERHIELIDPKIIVFLGNVATKNMLDTSRGILSIRGTWTDFALGEKTWPALPTLHPAYLLRNPAHKKLAWKDFLALKARIDAGTS